MFTRWTSALGAAGRLRVVRHLAVGEAGEEVAAAWLQEQGYSIVARRFRCRAGEVDIIARQGSFWVFVEVKTRRSGRFGPPAEAVTWSKQQRLARTAQYWLLCQGLDDVPCRFDVLEVLLMNSPPKVHHIPDAFGLG